MADVVCCPAPNLLVIDVASQELEDLRRHLAADHVHLDWCPDGAEALIRIGEALPAALLISSASPIMGTVEAIAAVRRRGDLPIIVGLPANGPTDGIATLLAAGATACVPQPYRPEDVRPLLAGVASKAATSREDLNYGLFALDRCGHIATFDGTELRLSLKEFALLEYLLTRRGRVASRREIAEAVWDGIEDTNTIVVHMKRLRHKIGDPGDGRILQTIRGVGYRIAANAQPTTERAPTRNVLAEA